MSATSNTPARNIRIPDELWSASRERAGTEETTVSAIVVAALQAYVEGGDAAPLSRAWRDGFQLGFGCARDHDDEDWIEALSSVRNPYRRRRTPA